MACTCRTPGEHALAVNHLTNEPETIRVAAIATCRVTASRTDMA